jgi:hypothetical protein
VDALRVRELCTHARGRTCEWWRHGPSDHHQRHHQKFRIQNKSRGQAEKKLVLFGGYLMILIWMT